jgi:hypothetical protein
MKNRKRWIPWEEGGWHAREQGNKVFPPLKKKMILMPTNEEGHREQEPEAKRRRVQ